MAKPAGTTDTDDPLAHFIARVVAGSDAIADDGVRFLMSPRQRRDLVAAHRAGNRALVERRAAAPAAGRRLTQATRQARRTAATSRAVTGAGGAAPRAAAA